MTDSRRRLSRVAIQRVPSVVSGASPHGPTRTPPASNGAPDGSEERPPSADDVAPVHVADLADEFNRLLSTIQVDASVLEQEAADGSASTGLAREILAASEKLAVLSRTLLKQVPESSAPPTPRSTPGPRAPRPADAETARVTSLDLNGLVLRTAATLGKVLDGDVDVRTQLYDEPLPIRGDPHRLKQALFRLAVAARESMVPGGTLQLETQHLTITARQASWIGDTQPGDYASLRLLYPASGDPPTAPAARRGADGRRRTSRFVRGLADAQRIATEARGHLQVAVTPGSPSWFTLLLPLAERPDDELARVLRDSWPPTPSALVLVVDGDPAERSQLSLMLKSTGYSVLEAESAEEVAVLLEDEGQPPKLLVTDVVLPGLSGPDLADQLGSRFHELQVIYTSNLDRQVIVSCGDLNPDSPFVSKPCAEEALLPLVRRLLDTPTG